MSDDDIREKIFDEIWEGKLGAVSELLTKITPNIFDDEGNTLLDIAVRQEDIVMVKLLLSKGVDPNLYPKKSNQSSLMYACEKGNNLLVELLLEKGADINATDINNYTALNYVYIINKLNILTLLLDKGANPNIKDIKGETILLDACRHNKVDVIKILLQYPIDLDVVNDKGETAIMIVCNSEYVPETPIRLLVNKGADLSIQNKLDENNTALHYLIPKIHFVFTDILEFMGKDKSKYSSLLNIKNDKGDTPFTLILERGTAHNARWIQTCIRNFEFSSEDTQHIFVKTYSTILTKLFLHINTFHITDEYISAVCNMIFKFNWETFKLFCIKYMFTHHSVDIISRYYEDKSLNIYKNNDGELYLRIFGVYDAKIGDENYEKLIYEIRGIHVSYYNVIKVLESINDSLEFVEILDINWGERPFKTKYIDKLLNKNLKQFTGKLTFKRTKQKVLNAIKTCYVDYYDAHQEGYKLIKYYSHIGDRCMHNILRGRPHLNTLEYCKEPNESIEQMMYNLNEFILNSRRECRTVKTEPIYLYRGTDMANIPLTRNSKIDSMKDQFVSFSSDFDVATYFGTIILELMVTPEDIILPIEDIQYKSETISLYPTEKEWLCPIYTRFIVYETPYVYKRFIVVPIKIIS